MVQEESGGRGEGATWGGNELSSVASCQDDYMQVITISTPSQNEPRNTRVDGDIPEGWQDLLEVRNRQH